MVKSQRSKSTGPHKNAFGCNSQIRTLMITQFKLIKNIRVITIYHQKVKGQFHFDITMFCETVQAITQHYVLHYNAP